MSHRRMLMLLIAVMLIGTATAEEIWFYRDGSEQDLFIYSYPDGGSSFETTSEVLHDGKPVLHVTLTGREYAGVGLCLSVPRNLEAGLKTGTVKFFGRAKSGTASFKLSLMTEEKENRQLVAKNEELLSATAEWKEYAVPLKDFFGLGARVFAYDTQERKMEPADTFDASRVQQLKFESQPPENCDLYLCDVRIEVP